MRIDWRSGDKAVIVFDADEFKNFLSDLARFGVETDMEVQRYMDLGFIPAVRLERPFDEFFPWLNPAVPEEAGILLVSAAREDCRAELHRHLHQSRAASN